MSTILKSPDGLKNSECKKGQLSSRPPIPYVAEMDIIMPKEEPQVLKVKLPDNSHMNMHIYSRENTQKYLMHIVAVLCIIKQKGLDARCRKLVCVCVCFWPPVPKWGPVKHEIPISSPPLDDIPSIP
jgi:hypothetical protein